MVALGQPLTCLGCTVPGSAGTMMSGGERAGHLCSSRLSSHMGKMCDAMSSLGLGWRCSSVTRWIVRGNLGGTRTVPLPVLPSAKQHELMTLDGFMMYLLSPEGAALDAAHTCVFQDMDQPLTHYFISSSHNTYLTDSQIGGPSSTEAYVRYWGWASSLGNAVWCGGGGVGATWGLPGSAWSTALP